MPTPDDKQTPEREELPTDEELGLDDFLPKDQPESVGLDTETGVEDDDSLYQLELPPTLTSDEGGEDDVDFDAGLGLAAGDDEYGWSDDADRRDDPWAPEELAFVRELPALGADDGGALGVEEVWERAPKEGPGDDDAPLPPLLRNDEDLEGLDLGDAWGDAPVLAAFEPAPPFSAGVKIEQLANVPIGDLRWAADTIVAAGEELAFFRGDRTARLVPQGVQGPLTQLALVPNDPSTLVAIGRGGNLVRSHDGGRSFDSVSTTELVGLAFENRQQLSAQEPRLWGWSQTGGLFLSDDLGGEWRGPLLLQPVVAFHAGERNPTALCVLREKGEGGDTQLATAIDATGARWSAAHAPSLPSRPAATFVLATLDDVIAIASDAGPGLWLSKDAGARWQKVPGVPPVTAAVLVQEQGRLSIYAGHLEQETESVVRYRLDGDEPGTVFSASHPSGRIRQLIAETAEDSTVLYIGSQSGLYRVRVDPDRLQ